MIKEITLGHIPIKIDFRLQDTEKYFKGYITKKQCDNWDIRVGDSDILLYPQICPDRKLTPYSEAYLLIAKTSAYLLQYRCVLIHGVSFLWKGKSWLITAPSGTGKTTQLRHLQKLFPEEIELINGDKTLLLQDKEGVFWLYPSPWTGKEKDVGKAHGKLGGIVVLEQGVENRIRQIHPRESVLKIFQQFLIIGLDSAVVKAVGKMESELLNNTPVFLMTNKGDEDSAVMMRDTLNEVRGNNL